MGSQVIVNHLGEPCSHGWLHRDRATTIDVDAIRLPDPSVRRITSVDLTVISASECFELGRTFMEAESYQEAADQFHAAIQLDWTFLGGHIELGNALSGLKEFRRALEAYYNALEVDGRSILAHYNIAVTLADAGELDNARQWLRKTLNVAPTYQPAFVQLARLSDKDHVAIALLLKASRLRPKGADALVEAGNLYYQNTQYVLAIRCYKRALRLDPWHADAFFRLGLAHYRNGRLAEAGIALANAVNRDPSFEAAAVVLKGLERRLSRKAQSESIPIQSQLW